MRSVKAVVEDAKVFLERSEVNANAQTEAIDHINEERKGDSSRAKKSAGNNGKNRQHVQTSRTTECEQDTGNSEEHSESVTASERRKMRQIATLVLQTPGEKRYNLKRHKT